MSPFTFVGNRIDRFVLPLVSRHALDVLKRGYDSTAAHRDTGCHLPPWFIALQRGGRYAEQPS